MTEESKSYYRRPGTIISWWYPESRDEPLHEHYAEQLRWVLGRFDWQGKRVADIGTGKGRFATSFALSGADVHALDISRDMLERARVDTREAGSRVHYLQGDAENLPYPDDFFDVVACMETIMHVPHPDRLLQELARVVHPGGQIILSMTNKYRINALVRLPENAYRRLRARHGDHARGYVWFYSVAQFVELIRQAGLRVRTLHGQGLFQANARLRLTRRLSVPIFPRPFALWFFNKIEPRLRETPLLYIMGTIMAIAVPRIESNPVS